MTATDIVVLKFGSSVLRAPSDYRTAALEVRRQVRGGLRVVAVASAAGRATDELLATARGLCPHPPPAALAPLLATGERASAALLAIALEAAGLPAALLDPVEAGLVAGGNPLDAEPRWLDVVLIRRVLAARAVAVLPGFFGVDAGGRVVLLGRGGSDLSALFVAHRLGAPCRLLKDVDGIYARDPASGGTPPRFAALEYDDAEALGARVVQARALAYARAHGVAFTVGAMGGAPGTQVGPGPTRMAGVPEPPAPRLAVAGTEP